MNIYDVIKAPLVTEKAALNKGEKSEYYFRVDSRATKIDIRLAVEKLFNVKIDDVRTVTMHGKARRNPRARAPMAAKSWKKAIVTLKKGSKIELFEGV